MKFLVIARPTGTSVEPEPDYMVGIFERFRDWMQEQVSAGRIDVAYLLSEGGGCSVCNADSAEELMELLLGSPVGALFRYEARPLVDFDAGMGRAIDAMREARWGPQQREYRAAVAANR